MTTMESICFTDKPKVKAIGPFSMKYNFFDENFSSELNLQVVYVGNEWNKMVDIDKSGIEGRFLRTQFIISLFTEFIEKDYSLFLNHNNQKFKKMLEEKIPEWTKQCQTSLSYKLRKISEKVVLKYNLQLKY